MYDSPTNRPRGKRSAHPSRWVRTQGWPSGGRESVISFSGGGENETRRPRSCRNTGKLINCSNLSRASPFSPPCLPPPVPLSAGIKDPHKFHSARPSTLAGARTGVRSLHPRRRNAPARASGIAIRAWEISKEEAELHSLDSLPPPSSRPRNARDIRPSDKRHNVIYGGYVATTGKKSARGVLLRDCPPVFPLEATNPRVFPRA